MQIRRAEFGDAADCARIQVDGWRFTYRGVFPDWYLDTLSYDEFQQRWEAGILAQDPARPRWIALVEDKPSGFLVASPPGLDVPGFPNQLSAIYTRPGLQRLGMGAALVNTYKNWLRSQGQTAFHLWVGKQNARAIAFYEAQGGRPVAERSDREFGGVFITEWAYGWSQL